MNLPPNVCAVKDRLGKTRFRFRKKGYPSRYIPSPDDPNFAQKYKDCFDTNQRIPTKAIQKKLNLRNPMTNLKGISLVYFIGMKNSIKIGKTVNLHARLKKLQTGSPVRLRVLAYIEGGADLELEYHSRFAKDRVHGEWFRKSDAIMDEIKRILSSGNDRP